MDFFTFAFPGFSSVNYSPIIFLFKQYDKCLFSSKDNVGYGVAF
jgi:hypothetical protein